MNKKGFVADITRNYFDTCENDPEFYTKSNTFTRHWKLFPERLLMILLWRLIMCL